VLIKTLLDVLIFKSSVIFSVSNQLGLKLVFLRLHCVSAMYCKCRAVILSTTRGGGGWVRFCDTSPTLSRTSPWSSIKMLSTLKLFPDVDQQEEQGSLKNRASTKTVSSLRLIGEIYIQLYLTKHFVALNTTIFL